jgi:hypothetical protein
MLAGNRTLVDAVLVGTGFAFVDVGERVTGENKVLL